MMTTLQATRRLITIATLLAITLPAFGQLIITGRLPINQKEANPRFSIDTLKISEDSVFVTVKKFDHGTLVHQEGQIFVWINDGQTRTLSQTIFHGPSAQWYTNGKKKCEGHFEQGKKMGLWSYWDTQGSLTHDIGRDSAYLNIRLGDALFFLDGRPVQIRKE